MLMKSRLVGERVVHLGCRVVHFLKRTRLGGRNVAEGPLLSGLRKRSPLCLCPSLLLN